MTGQADVDPHGVDRCGIPVGRPGDADEVAAVVALLADPVAALRDRLVMGRRWRHASDGTAAGSHLTAPQWRRGDP
jgi:hypothetical protein